MNKYEIKRSKETVAIVECPHHENGLPRVGSIACTECKHHKKVEAKHVLCCADEETD
jgi:hypothetical protein